MTVLRPSSDLITGGWASSPSGTLSSCIDETTASDTDYIATSTAGDIARVSLGTYTTSAGTHTLKYRAASPEADRGLIARVLELGQPPAIILKRDVWTSQPQTSVGIDWENPLTSDLKHAYIGSDSSFRNIVNSRRPSAVANVTVLPSIDGVAKKFNGTSSEVTGDPSQVTVSTDSVTLFMRFNAQSWSVSNNFLVCDATGFIALSSGSGGAANFVAVNRGGSTTKKTSDTMSLNKWYSIVATFSAGSVTGLYVDGVSHFAAGVTYSMSGDSNVRFGRRTASTAWTNGQISIAGVFKRILTLQEVASLSANPWQIFKPKSRPIFIDAPKVLATQTTTSGAIATTPTEYTLTLSAGEVASITNGSELALEIEST